MMKKPQLASATAAALPDKEVWPASLKPWQIRILQQALNTFTKKYLAGWKPIKVDGKMGPATWKRIRFAKYYLGQYRPKGGYSTKVSRQFMRRLGAPNNERLVIAKHPAAVVASGKKRRQRQNKLRRENAAHWNGVAGVVVYDGVQVASYFPVALNWARNVGWNGLKWRGHPTSGFRTPAYSRHLCYAMCGAPTCPGRCAGEYTNHAGFDPKKTPSGAIDLTDYDRFKLLMQHCPFQQLGIPRIFNDLPIDPVHFSPSGH